MFLDNLHNYRQTLGICNQGMTERKQASGASGIPKPVLGDPNPATARQSLYKKFGNRPEDAGPAPPPKFEPSLTRLTRESFRLLPRESMAWLSQLPRLGTNLFLLIFKTQKNNKVALSS